MGEPQRLSPKGGKIMPIKKHNLCGTRDYKKWASIKTRCYNENDHNYKKYGARDIKMHDSWLNNPAAFCEYIQGLDNYPVGFNHNITIDRINNDKDYEPGNLKWSTKSEQALNRRFNGVSGEKHIRYSEKEAGRKKYRVGGGKRFATLNEALTNRKEVYGF